MPRNSRHTLWVGIVAALVWAGCSKPKTVYSHYEHTPLAGWERNDTLLYHVAAMPSDGDYSEEIGLCINDTYPFMGLTLIVKQTVFPSHEVRRDTLNCVLTDEQGTTLSNGISQYQYTFPLPSLRLQQGDSVRVAVRHDMKREILPGISSVGVRVWRE